MLPQNYKNIQRKVLLTQHRKSAQKFQIKYGNNHKNLKEKIKLSGVYNLISVIPIPGIILDNYQVNGQFKTFIKSSIQIHSYRQNIDEYFQFGKLKIMTKQTREFMNNYFKKCQKKIKQYQNKDQLGNQYLVKNPYMQYPNMGYLHTCAPYGLVHGYPPDPKRFQEFIKFNLQPVFMQNQPKYAYPEIFIPPQMRMGIQKHQIQKNSDIIKNHYCPFQFGPMATHPPSFAIPHQIPVSLQNNHQPKFGGMQKKKTEPQHKCNKNKYCCDLKQSDSPAKKLPTSQKKDLSEMGPFIISPPNPLKGNRCDIPQFLPKTTSLQNETFHMVSNQKLHKTPIQQSTIPDQKSKKSSPQPQSQSQSQSQLQPQKPLSLPPKPTQPPSPLQPFNTINMCMSTQYKQQLKFCLCNGYGNSPSIYSCLNCKKIFHYCCTSKRDISNTNSNKTNTEINSLGGNNYIKEEICHFCFMIELDPLNKIEFVLGSAYITNIQQNKFNKNINFQVFDQYLIKNSQYQIELRCMKLEDASNLIPEYTWPDQCLIMINSQKAFEFQALQNNSSLKKRKDTSMFLTSYIHHCPRNYINRKNLSVGLEIKDIPNEDLNHKKIRNYYVFLLGIYLIRKKTPDQLCEEIKKNTGNKVRFAEKAFMNAVCQVDEQVLIQQIKVNLMDPFTWNIIDMPVRGTKCVHGQCFDLKTFLSFMNVQRVRQWKCPVCNKDCRTFQVDIQQLQAIKQFKKHQNEGNGHKLSNEISFHRDGKTRFIMLNERDDENDEKQSEDPKKTKLIMKDQKTVL